MQALHETQKPVDPKQAKRHCEKKAGVDRQVKDDHKQRAVWVAYAFSEKLHDWVICGFIRRRKCSKRQLDKVRVRNGLRADVPIRAVDLYTAAAFEHRLYVGERVTYLHTVTLRCTDYFDIAKQTEVLTGIAGEGSVREFKLDIFGHQCTYEVATIMTKAALEHALRLRNLLVIS